jgi:hypothetical protein
MKLWISKPQGYTPLLQLAGGRVKLLDLSPRQVVENMGADMSGFTPVKYGKYIGWVDKRYLEDYQEALPKDCVYVADIATPDEFDAQQYVNWNGIKQVNMCGQMCICHLLDSRMTLTNLLTTWKSKSPSLFTRIFGAGRARGTANWLKCWQYSRKPQKN